MIRDSVHISDWIVFLQDKMSLLRESLIFAGTGVLTIIIFVVTIPIPIDIITIGIFRLIVIICVWLFFNKYYKRLKKEYEPYQKLLLKIMRKEITRTKDVLIEYENIEKNKDEII